MPNDEQQVQQRKAERDAKAGNDTGLFESECRHVYTLAQVAAFEKRIIFYRPNDR